MKNINIKFTTAKINPHAPKLMTEWTVDLDNNGEQIFDLYHGKLIVLDCLGPSEFVVDFIDTNGYAYLRSNEVCCIGKKVNDDTWEINNLFYSLDVAKQLKIWYE